MGRGQVIDNAGQRPPQLLPGGNYDVYMVEEFTDEDGFACARLANFSRLPKFRYRVEFQVIITTNISMSNL